MTLSIHKSQRQCLDDLKLRLSRDDVSYKLFEFAYREVAKRNLWSRLPPIKMTMITRRKNMLEEFMASKYVKKQTDASVKDTEFKDVFYAFIEYYEMQHQQKQWKPEWTPDYYSVIFQLHELEYDVMHGVIRGVILVS